VYKCFWIVWWWRHFIKKNFCFNDHAAVLGALFCYFSGCFGISDCEAMFVRLIKERNSVAVEKSLFVCRCIVKLIIMLS